MFLRVICHKDKAVTTGNETDMLSHRAKYTIRVMQELARCPQEQSLQAGELAARIKASQHFLEGILLDLRRKGFLTSRRGPFRPPELYLFQT